MMFLQITSSPWRDEFIPDEGVLRLNSAEGWCWWWTLSRLLVRKGFHVKRLLLCWLLVPLSVVLSRSLLLIRVKWKKSAARLRRPVNVRSLPLVPIRKIKQMLNKKFGGIESLLIRAECATCFICVGSSSLWRCKINSRDALPSQNKISLSSYDYNENANEEAPMLVFS